jgi:hypothetical protein
MPPHELGSVLVYAVIDAMREIFKRRVGNLMAVYSLRATPDAQLSWEYRELLAEEAAKTAGHVLSLCIRAIDYCPPVDVTFGEFLRAMITADYDLVEDDHLGYRDFLIAAFGRRGIYPSDVDDLSEPLLWRRPTVELPKIGGEGLRLLADPDASDMDSETKRLAQCLADVATDPQHMREFGLSPDAGTVPEIESVRTLRRVGPDRQVRLGIVAEVLQRGKRSAGGLAFYGGATVVADVDGTIRYVVRKRVDDDARAERQAVFLGTEQGRAQISAATRHRVCSVSPRKAENRRHGND